MSIKTGSGNRDDSNLDRLEFKVDSGARISLPIVFEFRQIGI